jgi:sigma-E factor negative regulatory protein RseC
MSAQICIEQQGIVEDVSDRNVKVKIQQISACALCHVKGLCSMADYTEKIIDTVDTEGNLHAGDKVSITLSRSMGNKAVLFGYMFPFLLFISVLILLTSLSIKEIISGLASLAVLIPYYLGLYLFRERLQKTFKFTIKKVD